MQEFDINIFANSSQAFCIVRVDLDEGGKPFSYTPVFFNQALMNLVRVEEGRTIEEQCPMLFQNMNPRWLRIFYNAAYENHKSEIEDISEDMADTFVYNVFLQVLDTVPASSMIFPSRC